MEDVKSVKTQNEEEEEEKLKKQKEEKAILDEYAEECLRKKNWKESLRAKNSDINSRPDENEFRKLDSSLKKNTAFIRKIKNYSDGQKESLMKELKSLNLTKYIEEVASAIVEAKFKTTDLQGIVEVCSELHVLYAEFSQLFLLSWTKALTFKKEIPNPSKMRVDLRLFADLISVGVFTLKEGLPLLGTVLTSLVALDKEFHAHISIILTFCKQCGSDYAGLIPRRIRILAARYEITIPSCSLLPLERLKNVRQMLKDYFSSVVSHLIREARKVKTLERNNRKILLTKGEVHSLSLEKAERANVDFIKLKSNAEQLADVLDEELPELESVDSDNEEGVEGGPDIISIVPGEDSESLLVNGIWEDEDTRMFYQSIPDLKAFIPAILYKDSSSTPVETPSDIIADEDEEPEQSELEEVTVPPSIEIEAEDPEEEPTPATTSNKKQLEAFLANLSTCISREMIDKAAENFCMKLNTKINRIRLVKSLFGVHRNRQDLLPFYARFVATLAPCIPEIPVDLGSYLKQEFRWQLRKKDQMKIESKLKVMRFIGELVKFKMFPKSDALLCMKQLLFNFSHHHIEMACTLMETAGRFLLCTTESHQRTKIYLEQMMRKKQAVMSSDSRYAMMIENAFYTVCPPENSATTKVVSIPPMHQYIKKLIFENLCKSTVDETLKRLRRLDWGDSNVVDFIVDSLCAVENMEYYNIQYLSLLIANLIVYHDFLGSRIVDNILEDIRLGMEISDPKYNQRRLSVIKFLGECYKYRIVDCSLIFKVLYSLISFGAGDEFLDPPDHTLRIRLVCTLLNICAPYFSTSNNKLDYFVIYFQRYYWAKRSCFENQDLKFPFGIINIVNETLPILKTKTKIFTSFDETESAVKNVEKSMLELIKQSAPDLAQKLKNATADLEIQETDQTHLRVILEEEEDENDEEDPIYEEEDSDKPEGNFIDDEYEYDEYTQSQGIGDSLEEDSQIQDELSQDADDDDEEDDDEDESDYESSYAPKSRSRFGPKFVPCQEDDEFVALLDKMLSENTSSSMRPKGVDISVPVNLGGNRAKSFVDPLKPENENGDTIQFSVLLKKPQSGNKQIYRSVSMPKDSELVINLQKNEEEARREKERVKKLTLEMNERQEEEDLNEALASLQRPSLVSFNRDNRRRFNPHKGAPDADLIFGSKR